MTRKPIDNWYWELLLEACGNKCGCCGKHQSELRQPLQRGHIKLHSAGGDAEPENIMPVCLPCNKEHTKTDTPFDHLPSDYLARVAVLVVRRINPKYHVYVFSEHVDMILRSDSDENKELASLQAGIFSDCKALYTRSRHLDPHAAQRIVDTLISESRQHPRPPIIPNPGQQGLLRDLVRKYTPEIFSWVGAEWIKQVRWINDEGRYVHDPWGQFIYGFQFLLQEIRVAANRAEQQAEESRAYEAKQIEDQKARQRDWRWKQFKCVVGLSWPGIGEEDAATVAAVTANGMTDEVQDVTDKQVSASLEVWRRFTDYKREEERKAQNKLVAKHAKLKAILEKCRQWVGELTDEGERCDTLKAIENLEDMVASCKDLTSLEENEWSVHELYERLDSQTDPSRKNGSIVLFDPNDNQNKKPKDWNNF